jgi:type IV pilus assembly protein PilQ
MTLRAKILVFCLVLYGIQTWSGSADARLNSTDNITTQRIKVLDFKNTDLKDAVRAIAEKYNLNIFVDDNINRRITIHLTDVSPDRAIRFIVEKQGLRIDKKDNIYQILEPPLPEPPPPPPLKINVRDDLLSIDVENKKLSTVIRQLSEKSGQNIVMATGVTGQVTGFLQSMPFEKGLRTFLNVNGFELHRQDGVFHVDYGFRDTESDSKRGNRFWVSARDSLVTLDVVQAPIKDILQEIAIQMGFDLILYGDVEGSITAKCSKIKLNDALNYLFINTPYSFRREDDIYFVGKKEMHGMTFSKLVELQHLKAEGLMDLLPKRIQENATIKIVREHNGLMVIGTQDLIRETQEFIRQIDRPIPQILIEALVVDYNQSQISEFDVQAGIGASDSVSVMQSLFPTLHASSDGDYLNSQISLYGPKWGIPQVGKLPSDFYIRIKALEKEGYANIRSRPQIATLNGHTASISIGTTQYFILKTNTPYSSPNQVYVQESQRFETIKAEMLLKITPWVSASGEITTEIHPEFSTPKGGLDSERPPTIDHRILDSTVKLQDGETIILGGLIQDSDSRDFNKVPILGDLPLLGGLFRSYAKNRVETELMIYVTPHLSYTEKKPKEFDGFIQ